MPRPHFNLIQNQPFTLTLSSQLQEAGPYVRIHVYMHVCRIHTCHGHRAHCEDVGLPAHLGSFVPQSQNAGCLPGVGVSASPFQRITRSGHVGLLSGELASALSMAPWVLCLPVEGASFPVE